MCRDQKPLHVDGRLKAWAKAVAAPDSPIRRPDIRPGGEPIPAPGLPPGGVPTYLKPIPFNTRDIMRLLDDAIAEDAPPLMRILYSSWTAQAEALKYQEIRNALRDGEFSQAVFDEWRLEFSRMTSERLGPSLEVLGKRLGGITVEGFVQSGGDSRIYALFERGIGKYFAEHAADLAVNLEREQVLAIRTILTDLRVRGVTDPVAAARFLRPAVGLTKKAAEAVVNYRLDLEVGGELTAAQIEHQVQNYAARLERIRAERIAKTELAFAANAGNQLAAESAADSGMFAAVRKKLVVNPSKVCPFCESVERLQPPEGIDVKESFPGLTRRSPNLINPPLHPNCFCVVAYFFEL